MGYSVLSSFVRSSNHPAAASRMISGAATQHEMVWRRVGRRFVSCKKMYKHDIVLFIFPLIIIFTVRI